MSRVPGPPETSAPEPEARKRDAGLAASFASRRILGMRVDATCYDAAVDAIAELAEAGRGGMTCCASVHMVMEAWDDPGFRRIVNGADLVTPDGVPLVWGLRALGVPDATRVYGPELMPRLCEAAATRRIPVGFYGGSGAVLPELVRRLTQRLPALDVRFAHSPPFAPVPSEPDPELALTLRDSGTRLLFVGLGCPKQERFMSLYRESLPCAQVGVGAAFDFLAGSKRQAPRSLQDAGLEWLFRMLTEPRRLAGRYLVNVPRFIACFGAQLVRTALRGDQA